MPKFSPNAIPYEWQVRALREGALVTTLTVEGIATTREKVRRGVPVRDLLEFDAFKAFTSLETPIERLEQYAYDVGDSFAFGRLSKMILLNGHTEELRGFRSMLRDVQRGLRDDNLTF
jgi:hypothetical protein